MARRRRRINGLTRDILGYGLVGTGLAIGSNVVSSIGGDAAAKVGSGIVKGASYAPAFANLIIAKHIIRQTNKLYPKRRRRR